MPTTLFVSDLHLSGAQPALGKLFLSFLERRAAEAAALYILGDLFEVWIGDDAVQPEHAPILAGLRALTARGTPVYAMHGNRDFLLREGFAASSGCRLIADPTVIDLHGTPTLLMHGDALCTDDAEYQRFRAQMRDPRTQSSFLSLPVPQRIEVAQRYRAESQSRSQSKSQEIMDVNQGAVETALREHRVRRLIHGHTHRPAIHTFTLDSAPAQRIVLGDWHDNTGSVLVCDAHNCRLESFAG